MATCCGRKKVTYTAERPYIVGTDEGESVEIIASVNVMGFKANEKVWVRGSGVDALVSHGWVRFA